MSTTQGASAPQFENLYRPEALQSANPHVFPSVSSLLWFERLNRAELIEAGAVVELGGRKLLHGPKFIDAALAIGARRAAARSKGAA